MGLTRWLTKTELWFGKERWERTGDPHGINGPWVDRDPYKTLYAYFHRTLRRAKVVVVIGYSFHDKHVNQEVTKAARHAQIVVLDPGVLHYKQVRGRNAQAPAVRVVAVQRRRYRLVTLPLAGQEIRPARNDACTP